MKPVNIIILQLFLCFLFEKFIKIILFEKKERIALITAKLICGLHNGIVIFVFLNIIKYILLLFEGVYDIASPDAHDIRVAT